MKMVLMMLMKMKARGDEDGGPVPPAPGVEEAAPRREAPGDLPPSSSLVMEVM